MVPGCIGEAGRADVHVLTAPPDRVGDVRLRAGAGVEAGSRLRL